MIINFKKENGKEKLSLREHMRFHPETLGHPASTPATIAEF